MNLRTSLIVLLTITFPFLAESGEVTGKVAAASSGNGLAGAIVYVLSGVQPSSASPRRDAPKWTLREGRLDPQIFVVQAGESFTITNADATGYNVQVRFQNSTECNHALAQKGQTSIKAERPELFARVAEDLGRLQGYVCVLEHRVYALTDATGAFKLPDLPDGTYTIEVAHPREGRLRREIKVSSASMVVDFVLPGLAKAKTP